MTLIDGERADLLGAVMPPGIVASGGSAANTMVGVAGFGGRAAYLGLVADDYLGEAFRSDLRSAGVAFDVPGRANEMPTARCLIQVTPDAQRTLNTFLGISAHLSPDEIDEDLVASASHLYCEGYLWDMEPAKDGIRHAMDVARGAGRTVSLTLSDSFCVERHRADWRELLSGRVDVLFGNADELRALYEVDDLELAADAVAEDVEVAFVTPRQARLACGRGQRPHQGGRRRTRPRGSRHDGRRRPVRLGGVGRAQPGCVARACCPAGQHRRRRDHRPPGRKARGQPGGHRRTGPRLSPLLPASEPRAATG